MILGIGPCAGLRNYIASVGGEEWHVSVAETFTNTQINNRGPRVSRGRIRPRCRTNLPWDTSPPSWGEVDQENIMRSFRAQRRRGERRAIGGSKVPHRRSNQHRRGLPEPRHRTGRGGCIELQVCHSGAAPVSQTKSWPTFDRGHYGV